MPVSEPSSVEHTCDRCAESKPGCVYENDDPNGATLCPECVAESASARRSIGRTPAACPVCYALKGIGVAARVRTHGMHVCEEHGEALKDGKPLAVVNAFNRAALASGNEPYAS